MRIRVQILQMTPKVGTCNFPVVHQGLKFKISLGSDDDVDGHSKDDLIAADSQPAVAQLRPIPIGLPDHMLASLGEYIVNKFRKPLEIQLLGNDSDLESDGKKEGDDQPAVAQLRPIPIGLPDHMLASLGEYIVNKLTIPIWNQMGKSGNMVNPWLRRSGPSPSECQRICLQIWVRIWCINKWTILTLNY